MTSKICVCMGGTDPDVPCPDYPSRSLDDWAAIRSGSGRLADTTDPKLLPHELWAIANAEADSDEATREQYRALMSKHGYLVARCEVTIQLTGQRCELPNGHKGMHRERGHSFV